jgi:hypothetical protein
MNQVQSLSALKPDKHYRKVALPAELAAEFRTKHDVKIEEPVDGLCDLVGERWVIRAGGNTFRVVASGDTFTVFPDEPRHYASSPLPTLNGRIARAAKDETLLLGIYREVTSAWKSLTDVRFKLLGLVPAVSMIAWVQLLSADELNTTPGAWAGIVLALVGLSVTALLRIYDMRNDVLYDDLISRGRKIEEELGIDTGLFRGRPRAVDTNINHGVPLQWIYRLAIGGWFAVAIWFAAVVAGMEVGGGNP